MKKLIALVLVLILAISLASCDLFAGGISNGKGGENTVIPSITNSTTSGTTSTTTTNKPTTSTTTEPTTSTTTTTKPTTSTNGGQGTNPPEDYLYNAFTASEKSIMQDLFGEVIPFIPNNEYYFETFAQDNGDGTSTIGINFYTLGNTVSEFAEYRESFVNYIYVGSEIDEYGDTIYYYDSADGSYYIDVTHYYYDGEYVLDLYAYFLQDNSSSGGGESETHLYTDFTSSEKSLFNNVVGAIIPFIANDEYYVEEYSFDYEDGTTETGVNFYTVGNTSAEFDVYKALFSGYTYVGMDYDEYGDAWYYYDAKDLSYSIDISYYESEYGYVVDVYVYYLTETGSSGGGSGSGSGNNDYDVITNEGAGLPSESDGVFDIDFTKAETVKDVTDQGYYLDGCPTTGSPAVLVIPVDFKDATALSKGYSTDVLANAFGKNGITDYYSVYDYYYISSYGQLTLDITVLDYWFRPQYDSTYYENATYDYYGSEIAIGDQLIMDEALAYLEDKMDLSKFDSDNNGIIDAVVLINTLDVGDDDFHWAYRYWNIYTDEEGYYYEYDGVSANDYLWASYQFLNESSDAAGNIVYTDSSARNTYTYIHEFAHILGTDDYYDTAYIGSPLDGADMMDSMLGDHNAYTKFNLGWITSSRLVVTDSSVTLTLEDFSKNGDTIIIANNWDEKLGAYQEYYVIMYYKNIGLNAGEGAGFFARDGIVVYHVNASLYVETIEGETYYDVYNNNTDVSDQYGTEDNLIEFVKSSNDTFTYIEGDTMPSVSDDNGKVLAYNFVIDLLTEEYATITFTKN